jgi:hypothetical protein
MAEAFRFIGAVVNPPTPDPVAINFQKMITTMKERASAGETRPAPDGEPGQ